MDSGQIDFYQHDKVCTNTCRSTKFDLLISSARAPVPGQQSVVQTPTSADGKKAASSGTSFPLMLPPSLGLLNQVSRIAHHLLPACSRAVQEAAPVSGQEGASRVLSESCPRRRAGSSGWAAVAGGSLGSQGSSLRRDPSWLGAPCELEQCFLTCFLSEGL